MSTPTFRSIPGASLTLALCVLAAIGMLATRMAHAERADRDKPIFYQGDSGGANLGSKDGELAGNVVITQGTLTLRADRIVFHQNADNSLSATAYGNPVSFREKRDGVDEYYEGQAQRAVYDGQKRFLELFDRAVLKKSGDEIRSNYITYDAGAEVFKAEGRPDTRPPDAGDASLGPRVRGVFQPQAKDDKTSKNGKDAKDGKEVKEVKDGKASVPPKATPPLQLKGDSALAPAPASTK